MEFIEVNEKLKVLVKTEHFKNSILLKASKEEIEIGKKEISKIKYNKLFKAFVINILPYYAILTVFSIPMLYSPLSNINKYDSTAIIALNYFIVIIYSILFLIITYGVFFQSKGQMQKNCLTLNELPFIQNMTVKEHDIIMLHRERAQNGNRASLYLIAKQLYNGIYFNQNTDLAICLFSISANLGYAKSAYRLAELFRDGSENIDKNKTLYLKWLVKSSELNHLTAKTELNKLGISSTSSGILMGIVVGGIMF